MIVYRTTDPDGEWGIEQDGSVWLWEALGKRWVEGMGCSPYTSTVLRVGMVEWLMAEKRREEEAEIRKRARVVYAKLSPGVKCSSSCRIALGSVCVCSCGGLNHGVVHDKTRGLRRVIRED